MWAKEKKNIRKKLCWQLVRQAQWTSFVAFVHVRSTRPQMKLFQWIFAFAAYGHIIIFPASANTYTLSPTPHTTAIHCMLALNFSSLKTCSVCRVRAKKWIFTFSTQDSHERTKADDYSHTKMKSLGRPPARDGNVKEKGGPKSEFRTTRKFCAHHENGNLKKWKSC